ncbi:MAG: type II toxin-antitoxin system VapC family toxin [Burkholderiales bacterium]|nr:type II toxin-antitoxin system VapC family toxin [Opitutaceae bacterium]
MGLILDSSVLIAAERGKLRFSDFCISLGDEELFLAAITASELLHGVERAASPLIRTKRAAFVEALLSRFQVLEFDLDVARHHARLWAILAANGLVIGPHDMQIAATGLRHDFSVATLNLEEFRRVPSLRLADLREYL